MIHDLTKQERRHIRELAGLAWERELRTAITVLGQSIRQMEAGDLNPFQVSEIIHKHHNGVARELYSKYSHSFTWYAVCRAHMDGILTDRDIEGISDRMRSEMNRITADAMEMQRE